MNQADYTATQTGTSQASRVLECLRAARGQWVPMPDLARAGSGKLNGFCIVHSRVSDLRKLGHFIAHKDERRDRQCRSFYMLCESAAEVERVVGELVAPVEN